MIPDTSSKGERDVAAIREALELADFNHLGPRRRGEVYMGSTAALDSLSRTIEQQQAEIRNLLGAAREHARREVEQQARIEELERELAEGAISFKRIREGTSPTHPRRERTSE